MIGLRSNRRGLAAALIVAAVGAFAGLTFFEVKIARAEARTEAALSEILKQQQQLRSSSISELERRTVERRIADLALRAEPLVQEAGLVLTLQSIALRRGVQLLAIRARPSDRPKTRTRFEMRSYDVILEGAYRRVLVAMGDLSRAPLVTRLQQIDLARTDGAKTPPSSVRAILQLAVVRLATGRNVRAHAP